MRKFRNSRSTPQPGIYFDSGWRFLPNRAARRSAARRSYLLEAYVRTTALAAAVAALLVGRPDDEA